MNNDPTIGDRLKVVFLENVSISFVSEDVQMHGVGRLTTDLEKNR